tara:strand:+ start:49 stop:531 length:483 start_codon:yes stop_codon:yes gene_type:complete
MNKFLQGKIYKITDHTNNSIYIGSTIQKLKQRLRGHERDAYHPMINCASKSIILNNEYTIDLLIDYPCLCLEELRMKEQEFIDIIPCCNISKAYVSKEDKINNQKNYYNNNKKDILDKKKDYDSIYISCECGGGYCMSHRSRHRHTQKCINFFNQKNNIS